ncbi:MAG: PTS sugar transporter subunit IIA [Romboutsia sp.]
MYTALNMENIFIDLEMKEKEEVLIKISSLAKGLGICSEEKGLFESLLNREKEFSTNVVEGIAIPHIKSKDINRPSLIIIKLKNDIDWDNTGEMVSMIISMLYPEENYSNCHIKLLSKLSRKLIDNKFRNLLINSEEKESIYKRINVVLN